MYIFPRGRKRNWKGITLQAPSHEQVSFRTWWLPFQESHGQELGMRQSRGIQNLDFRSKTKAHGQVFRPGLPSQLEVKLSKPDGQVPALEARKVDFSALRLFGARGKHKLTVVVKTILGSHFGVGELTTHFRTYFSGDWDVQDPWPNWHEPMSLVHDPPHLRLLFSSFLAMAHVERLSSNY